MAARWRRLIGGPVLGSVHMFVSLCCAQQVRTGGRAPCRRVRVATLLIVPQVANGETKFEKLFTATVMC